MSIAQKVIGLLKSVFGISPQANANGLVLPNGSVASPSLTWNGLSAGIGLYEVANSIRISYSGADLILLAGSGSQTLFFGTDVRFYNGFCLGSAFDAFLVRSAAGVIGTTSNTWIQNTPELAELTANVTNSTATLANLSDMTLNPRSGRKYVKGELCLKCNNTVAVDGIQLDFNGGTATFTSFWAGGGVLASSGTDTIGMNISTSLAGVINFSVLTGETIVLIKFRGVCNAGGTLIPRAAVNSHSTGTLTVELGSWMTMSDCPN